MVVIALTSVLLLAVGGCVCVVWAARGGPRWVRAVAAVTLTIGSILRDSNRRRSRGSNGDGNNGSWGSDGGGGSDG
ncbi:hypothetical protein [Streptomyces zaomyceticus]|uniref:hypothetical protein n=1 Tax=Streptomyces zaomyceticus TaxID=68286 RepID=UPI0016763F4C|nr:hypothetical protein [Streptomyces zaomyceticus]GHG05426.1 hypothetical protein GCM10018791_17310 [Streptomyces zaomyceticus]